MTEPFDDREARDKEPGCTCGTRGLELDFKACEPLAPGEPWIVIDAECEPICTTPRQAFAELIAWALNAMDNGRCEVCRIHTRAWWRTRWEAFAPKCIRCGMTQADVDEAPDSYCNGDLHGVLGGVPHPEGESQSSQHHFAPDGRSPEPIDPIVDVNVSEAGGALLAGFFAGALMRKGADLLMGAIAKIPCEKCGRPSSAHAASDSTCAGYEPKTTNLYDPKEK